MPLIRLAEEAAHAFNATPFIAAGTAFAIFLFLGIVTWSYRDVANRHSHKFGSAGHSSAGHSSGGDSSGGHGSHDSHSTGH